MWPFDRLAAEWPKLAPMVEAAPTTVFFAVLSLLAIGFGVSAYLGKREKDALRAEKSSAETAIKSAEAATKLAEKARDLYKIEAENYQKELEKAHKIVGPTQLAPVMYGNAAIQNVYATVTSLPAMPVVISNIDYERLAAALRLQEAGLAQLRQTNPSSVVATDAGTALRQYYDAAKKEKEE